MGDDGFRSGSQSMVTIWTGEASGGICLCLFHGEVLFANGQRGACAGTETVEKGESGVGRSESARSRMTAIQLAAS